MGLKRRQQHLLTAAACMLLLAAFVQHAAADPDPGAAPAPATSRYELVNSRPGNVLVFILTECGKYIDWQTIAAAFAWRVSGQQGSMVRVANCNEEDTKKYNKKMLAYVKTHMAPQYAWNEELKDWYGAYNKPGAVVDYFKHNNPPEEWMVVLDSDMLMRKSFVPEELPLERGWAYAAKYDYLEGTNNQLALRHVQEVTPRNDTKAGRVGRRGDRVGGPYYMHRDDLRKLAPLWLNYTKRVRGDMEAYKDCGDNVKKGDRPWIAEMYGYSFGAAKSNVWHIWKEDFMLYPSYAPGSVPHVLHYGLIYTVAGWTFDKHFYFDFDSQECPPWDLTLKKPKSGIFPSPPGPKELETKDFLKRYQDLISVSVVALVNAALCDYHVRNCPPSPQLTSVCNKAFLLYHEVEQELRGIEWKFNCTDHKAECPGWAESGECTKMKQYMSDHCSVSCKLCKGPGQRPQNKWDKPMTVEELSAYIGVKAAAPEGAEGAASPSPAQEAKENNEEQKQKDKPASGAPKDASDQTTEDKPAAAKQEDQVEQPPAAATTSTATEDRSALAKVDNGQKKKDEETELRNKYPTSTLSYAVLVKRCTDLQGLTDEQMRECVRAAGLRREYPGQAANAVVTGAGAATESTTNTGRVVMADGAALSSGAAMTNDLASLHAMHEAAGKLAQHENVVGQKMAGSTSWLNFVEHVVGEASVVLVGVAVAWLGCSNLRNRSRFKAHWRSE